MEYFDTNRYVEVTFFIPSGQWVNSERSAWIDRIVRALVETQWKENRPKYAVLAVVNFSLGHIRFSVSNSSVLNEVNCRSQLRRGMKEWSVRLMFYDPYI